MKKKYDFAGWATRNDLLCTDGRTIRKDAFMHNDGEVVPLVYNHEHNSVDAILGKALLKNKPEGVYAYCSFNDTESGRTAKAAVQHGDVCSLSIYANGLKQSRFGDVVHGNIKELSLVLAGANPGAYIETVLAHSIDGSEELESLQASWNENIVLYHSDDMEEDNDMDEQNAIDIFNDMTDEQQRAVYEIVGASEDIDDDYDYDDDEYEDDYEDDYDDDESDEDYDEDYEEDDEMRHNIFEQDEVQGDTLSHSDMQAIIADGKKYGSLRDSFNAYTEGMELAHGDYGINNIDYLFPDAKTLNNTPEFIQRKMGWVPKVINGTHHTPFSRIKSVFADITADEARAKGYMKGNLKKEEVFSLLKRTTTPTTIYKKQKLDRDDVVDITDFDVVAWLKSEMRMMLDEEIARAILIGDGRLGSSDDKINEDNIRPIWTDSELYTIKTVIDGASATTAEAKAKAFIKAVIKSRKDYKGSGEPTLFTTEDVITDCLLLEDGIGHLLYDSIGKLATVLRVKEIVAVPVMEGANRTDNNGTYDLMGLVVNLNDYNVGADKGGAINMFDDFDIDYNQQKYLIETRCSGALTKPKSAISIEVKRTNNPSEVG